ncbi:GDP-fucose protein O-fucosyltransferase [Artemisia annua]|uniref:O-fucosyltransferase family protein n=1 Tax=Artemisia annua TaxID=35608 RepID=A0A2U1MEQ6_ARTAN|nr:GDP-fucose protein O-fucosyltransferase [Artemisia annua]
MFVANTSVGLVQHSVMTRFIEDLNIDVVGKQAVRSKSLWKKVKSLEVLQPYANPRSKYPDPVEQSNGFIYAKIFGEFEKIRSSICDLVAISRLLNATLVIPEIQDSTTSKGIRE